jgi:uncharacterized SAM-binding protein YcdF (DUF218 family)
MQLGELKPLLTALVLPPASPLLLALAALALARRRRALGTAIAAAAIVLTLALTTDVAARVLTAHLLPPIPAVQAKDLREVQAIVVLGGGIWSEAPEYGAPQPDESTLVRLRYGARLARQTGKPLAFAGGIGWGAGGESVSEAEVARRMLQEDYGLVPRWVDDRSRDTAENAARMAQVAGRAGVHRIALVTDAIHMPRAVILFRRAGFEVLPAPTHFPDQGRHGLLDWLPSTHGIDTCRYLVHEWLGRMLARMT